MPLQFELGGCWPVVTDANHILRAATIASRSAGITAPHPNSGCVIAVGPKILSEGFLRARGSRSAELQAVEKARGRAKGATAYLNLEPFTHEAVSALCEAELSRVVVGLTNPVSDQTGKAVETLKSAGIPVHVLGKRPEASNVYIKEAMKACENVNAPLLYAASHGIPYSTLLTAEGGRIRRELLSELRARSNAIVLGQKSLRQVLYDVMVNHMEVGHSPVRIVVSPSLDFLPEDSWLWDASMSRTLVATCRGSERREFERKLACRGVEVVELEALTPRALMEYCWDNLGFTSVLWECSGEFAAAAIISGVIHKLITVGGKSKLISTLLFAGDPPSVEEANSSSSCI